GLLTEVNASFLVKLAEVRIFKVFDKSDSFSGTLHFRTQIAAHAGEFVEAENRFFYCITFQAFDKSEVFQRCRSQHNFGSDIEVRNLIGFCNERSSTGSSWVGFDYIHFVVFYGKLNINQSPDVQPEGNLPGVFFHGFQNQRGKVECRKYGIAIATVNAGRFNMFHNSHHMEIFTIANRINLGFLTAVEEAVDKDFVIRKMFQQAYYASFQFLIIDNDTHSLSAQNITWPYQYRIANP